ncbi:efflux RND transporter permease subunit [Endozoicomonas gorgoniicola]|uniref:Efflux RND transporter permease subunit n=1 Tax=Endozoicomonas gorgoniicola TaxID=1234144 RepID=A0ABT3MUA1_9GAMM|nr:efflux RND transporter permease subunit [Endozoicomonas gorgoniicola]MCW7552554.1 efflux RND transporter permease subunit [Endozoicomonas gorgoniicola]
MHGAIKGILSRSRTVLMMFVLLLSLGSLSYITLPKEAAPDVPIPVVLVSVNYEGISPEDSERLMVLPLEKELRGIAGIKEMTSTASQSHASITVEFIAGLDISKVMADVRDKVNQAKSKLPEGSDEPVVKQVTIASMEPVITVILSGEMPERALIRIARKVRDVLEGRKEILEVTIGGDREDVIDVVIDPLKLESYGLIPADVVNLVTSNNRLVAAGNVDNGNGRFSVKVPAVYKTPADILAQPVKADGDKVITFADVATVRSTFKDGGSYASMNGEPSVSLEVKKRPGENIIQTIEITKAIVAEVKKQAPENLQVDYSKDQSKDVRLMLLDLQNNVLSAVILVVIVILGALGLRSSVLVGLAIPGAFLTGLLMIGIFGLTINMIVLFALIMSVGMLVDGAIVVTEFADRKMNEGLSRKEAYLQASLRMSWPITASTATTLAAFFPLMFWPGMMGEFMMYLPLTLIATLSASLLMALIFIPTIGALIGKPRKLSQAEAINVKASEAGELTTMVGLSGGYTRLLTKTLSHPGKIVLSGFLLVCGVYWTFARIGNGVEFFPNVETNYARVSILANSSNYSIDEKHEIIQLAEERLVNIPAIQSVYARTGEKRTIGTLSLTLVDWQYREPAPEVMTQIKEQLSVFSGLDILVNRQKDGPPAGIPLSLTIFSENLAHLNDSLRTVERILRKHPKIVNIEHNGSTPGYEWQMNIDRTQAARFGADVTTTGSVIQMVTSGLTVGSYRPDNSNDEVDIRIRLPEQDRHLESIDRLRLMTAAGLVPISHFTERSIASQLDNINHTDGLRSVNIGGELLEGEQLGKILPDLFAEIEASGLADGVTVEIKGEQADQQESQTFLIKAFAVALFVMAMILVSQFNSFYQAFLIMSAVVLSTGGVFIGLLITGQPFGIVMSGIGVISLAGIIVNNNIVLIDTYNTLRARGMDATQAVLRTGAQRLRPVLLTTVTTVLGLLPMVLSVNLDLFAHKIDIGAPSTQMWNQLSVAIVSGLSFATVLTLFITPCLLVMAGRIEDRRAARGTEVTEDVSNLL